VLSVALFFALSERINLANAVQWLSLAGIIIFASLQLFQAVRVHKESPLDQSRFDRDAYAQIMRIVPPEDLIAADISERISFYTGRRTLRLPSDPAELLEIDQKYLPVDYVLISKGLDQGDSGDPSEPGYHETYQDYDQFVVSLEFLDRFTLKRRLANGSILYQRTGHSP
jgi:hypothetical protein